MLCDISKLLIDISERGVHFVAYRVGIEYIAAIHWVKLDLRVFGSVQSHLICFSSLRVYRFCCSLHAVSDFEPIFRTLRVAHQLFTKERKLTNIKKMSER